MVMNHKYVYLREFSSANGQRRMNIFADLTLSVTSVYKVPLQIGHALLTDRCCQENFLQFAVHFTTRTDTTENLNFHVVY